MTDRQQHTELRVRFQAQRSTEASDAPPFASVLARARADAARTAPMATHQRRARRRLLYAGGLAAAALIATLLLLPRADSDEAVFERTVRSYQNGALGAWHSPTDGLLNVPGANLISTVPRIGTRP